MPKRSFKTVLTAFTLAALSACSLVKYQPVATINKIRPLAKIFIPSH